MRALCDVELHPNDQAAIVAAAAVLRDRFPVEAVYLFGLLPSEALLGVIGSISPERHERLLQRLGELLRSPRSA